METYFLSKQEVESVLTMKDAIKAVEDGFKINSSVEKSVKAWLFFTKQEGDLALWSAYIPPLNIAGMKAIGYNLNNYKKNLPTITATIILYDPNTSFPLAIIDGTSITTYRTGAAGAVAAKYLARKESKVLGLIGAGVQGYSQIKGLNEVFNVEKVKVYDIISEKRNQIAEKIKKELNLSVEVCDDAAESVTASDILVTATPAKQPIVKLDWVSEGLHINAIGADEPGKQEIQSEILKKARIVVDDRQESVRRGETNVPINQGVITASEIYAELEEIVKGDKIGRNSLKDITLFDATGIAMEDVVVAWTAFNKAKELGIGKAKEFVV